MQINQLAHAIQPIPPTPKILVMQCTKISLTLPNLTASIVLYNIVSICLQFI